MQEKVDSHHERLETVEQCISGVEDSGSTHKEKLLHMERVLELIHTKNEAIEARSKRNNIRIVGVRKCPF